GPETLGRTNGKAEPKSPRKPILPAWVRGQAINVTRHAAALRPFRREEFGNTAAAPSEAHVTAANQLIGSLRRGLVRMTRTVGKAAAQAIADPSPRKLQSMVRHKERAHRRVHAIETIWDFYFELFGQRMSPPYADWLLSCDRVALDCYQAAYMGLG